MGLANLMAGSLIAGISGTKLIVGVVGKFSVDCRY